MEIPLPQSMQNEDNIFKYGFDGSLNRSSAPPVIESNVEKTVQDVLANSGINLNTTSTPGSGSSGNFERNDFHWITLFESLSGYATNGATLTGGSITLATNGSGASNASMLKLPTYNFNRLTWDKNRKIRTRVRLIDNTAQTIWVISGDISTNKHIGFKVLDGTLYGTVANGLAESTLNFGNVSLSADGVSLEVKHTIGMGVEFYVNDIRAGIITTNIPTGTLYANRVIEIYLTESEAAVKTLYLSFWELWQAS